MNETAYLWLPEAARRCGITTRELLALIDEGRVPAVRLDRFGRWSIAVPASAIAELELG